MGMNLGDKEEKKFFEEDIKTYIKIIARSLYCMCPLLGSFLTMIRESSLFGSYIVLHTGDTPKRRCVKHSCHSYKSCF